MNGYGFFNPFGGGGSGGSQSQVDYSISQVIDSQTGEATYQLMQSIDGGTPVVVGDVISYNGNDLLVNYNNEVVLLNNAMETIGQRLGEIYDFTTFTELGIDTHNKTLVEITNELIAKHLPTNTIVTGQIYSQALPFNGNGEAEVMINGPAYWWKCGSLNVAPYSWAAITASSTWGDNGLVMDWTPTAYVLPNASANTLGGIKVGSRLSIDSNGVLSADDQSYSLPTASDQVLGGIKVGNRLSIDNNGILSAQDQSYTLPAATDQSLGGIKIGSRLSIDNNGVLSADDQSYSLPTASASTLGGIKVGSGLSITNGVLSATGGSSLKSTQISFVLDSDDWIENLDGTYSYQYSNQLIEATDFMDIGPALGITETQLNNLLSAKLVISSITDGYVNLTAYGDVPEIDIPMLLVIEGSYQEIYPTVDNDFSLASENPVQNKVITAKINELEGIIGNINEALEEILSGSVQVGAADTTTIQGYEVNNDIVGIAEQTEG